MRAVISRMITTPEERFSIPEIYLFLLEYLLKTSIYELKLNGTNYLDCFSS